MGDVMLFGIAQMPYEMAMGDEVSRMQFHANTQRLVERLQSAEARAEAAERDAARYRWLRDNAEIEWENRRGVGWHWKPNKPLYVPLDERIDTALAQQAAGEAVSA